MTDNITNRRYVLSFLKEELVGPAPAGKEIDCSQDVTFSSTEDARGPWKQQNSGEEILQRDPPTKRYGIGVLYPYGTVVGDTPQDVGIAATGLTSLIEGDNDPTSPLTENGFRSIEQAIHNVENTAKDEALSDLDLSASNTYRASSMGISFLAEIPEGAVVTVEARGGRYRQFSITAGSSTWTWWLRNPVSIVEEFDAKALASGQGTRVPAFSRSEENTEHLDLRIEVFSRPNPYSPHSNEKIVTVCLVNRSDVQGRNDEYCLFQSFFQVTVVTADKRNCILPYPEAPFRRLDDEEKSLALLYRKFDTYAVGHGCAANWHTKDRSGRVKRITAECLPDFETPSITPDIKDENGNPIEVPMFSLAGLDSSDDGLGSLQGIIKLYENWIELQKERLKKLDPTFHMTAERHLQLCDRCVQRMYDGLNFLLANPNAMKAFRLANYAILLQQLHSRREARTIVFNKKTGHYEFPEVYQEPDLSNIQGSRGKWRAFQIAFLLMSLHSSCDPNALDRETVELIWFPTGGGKTEAYLGLTAFSIFMRRLADPHDTGVHVLMRYTLRLLTAQQFQRASGLICAMDYLRKTVAPELGDVPFSIGIWVGGANTPNTRSEALTILSALNKGDKFAENKFILNKCPWCGAYMGPVDYSKGTPKEAPKVIGYIRAGKTVIFKCPDSSCYFAQGLPIYVIDEDIYEQKPSVVIGTVDKFAILTWKPNARTLFGLDEDGGRQSSPPGLIIQDELHLIAGPLGSMVGLFETVIEELCMDRRVNPPIPPKIVSSTATIRRYTEQIRALYGRSDVVLFPPPGLDADDSFFARYAADDSGQLLPGRLYIGVHAPGLGSLQTVQVRTFTALLQASTTISNIQERDPWWTLLVFFNSLRELGTTLSLFQSDIPDYLKVMANRLGFSFDNIRKLWRVKELTGRLRSDEVPEMLADLEVTTTSSDKKPVDVCLASNILEVGVDIDRLSVMSVVGQPKSTSQYIQVTGRVGRRWWERPGLVVTIYTASKPRDRSHFEKFRSYHERLYAQVEPVSVTPFSPPVLDRGLHAIMALYSRQLGDASISARPYPYPDKLVEQLRNILLPRVREIDPAEVTNFERVFNERAAEWKRWQRTEWGEIARSQVAQDIPLLRAAGTYANAEQKLLSWSTPTSMRNVDAECEAQITALYLLDDLTSEGQ